MSVFGCTIRLDGGYTVVRFASQTWYSDPDDSIGLLQWDGRIEAGSEPTFGIRVGCVLWGTDTFSSFGSLQLVNTDGALTWLVGTSARDSDCELFVIGEGQTWDTRSIIARCLVDRIELGEDAVQVFLKSRGALLDRPIQPQSFPDTTPNEQLRGTALPTMIGKVFQAEPALVDPNEASPPSLIYRATDGIITEIEDVLSGGSPANGPNDSPPQWDYIPSGFAMFIDPAARITINATGASIISPDNLAGTGEFFLPANWTGGNPNDWTVTATAGAVSEAPEVGLRMTAPIGNEGDPLVESDALLLGGTWFMLQVKVARIVSGQLRLVVGTTELPIVGEGTSFYLVQTQALGPLVIENASASQLDATVAAVYAYPFDTAPTSATMTQLVKHLLLRAGFTETEIDVTQWNGQPVLSTTMAYPAGFYTKGQQTIAQTIREAMASVTGWLYVALDGSIRAGTIDDPDAYTPSLTVSRLNLVTYPRFTPDEAPGLSDSWGAARNWSPYQESELAGITYPEQPPFLAEYRDVRRIFVQTGDGDFGFPFARSYRGAIGRPPIRTLLTDGDDAEAEGRRVCDLYLRERGFWTFVVAFDSPVQAAAVQPGDVVHLDPDLFGFTSGTGKGFVVEVQGRFRDNTVQLTVWTTST